MDEFIELVLRGTLSDPFTRKFNLAAWERAAKESGTERVTNLVKSAILIRQYAEAILERLNSTEYLKAAPVELVNSFLVVANSIAFDFHARHLSQIDKAGKYNISVFPRVAVAGGTKFSIADANTALIDSLRLPLSIIIPKLLPTTELIFDHLANDKGTEPILALASAWHELKIIWQRCLFFEHKLTEYPEHIALSGDFDLSYFVVGRARQMHDNMASFAAREYVKKQQKPGKVKERSTRRKGLDLVHAQPRPDGEDDSPLDEFQRTFVLPAIVDGEKTTLTYRTLIKAFDFLGEVVGNSYQRLDKRRIKDPYKGNVFLDIECRYSKKSIIKAISEETGTDEKNAAHIMDILTYAGSGEFDPWETPIIDMRDGSYCLMAGVLGPANRAFILDTLMKAQNFDLDSRGPGFEKFFERELTSAIPRCPFGSIVKVSSAGVAIAINGVREEIDLLISIGRDLYVAECKCALFPVDLADEYYFVSRMQEADAQLKRKLAFLHAGKDHLNMLHPSLRDFPVPDQIKGLVVTTFQGGPAAFSEFPITTPEFVVSYFTSGRSMTQLEAGKKGIKVFDAAAVEHYNSFETFRKNFWKCQVRQPYLLTFQQMLRRFENRLPFDETLGLKPFIVDESEVVIPEDESERREILRQSGIYLRKYLLP